MKNLLRLSRSAPRALCGSVADFVAHGQRVGRNVGRGHRAPSGPKRAVVSEELAKQLIAHLHLNAVAVRFVIIPLLHVGQARKQHGKPERHRPLVEALLARAQPQGAPRGHGRVNIDGQVLVRAQVIDDTATPKSDTCGV